LYLAEAHEWNDIPAELRQLLGDCEVVMQLNLKQRDRLASEDIQVVRDNLACQGYHLQMPPRNSTGVIDYNNR